jgi:CHAT domain-containing protein/tetratricopeptide (TPR) repeat protein
MSDHVSPHPTEETLAAFIEGSLARPEIADVLSHMRDCPECRTSVARTADFYDQERRRGAPVWWRPIAAAAVLAIVIAGAILLLQHADRPPVQTLIVAAPREHRSIEARLAGFPWARVQVPPRGGAPLDPADLKLAGAAGDVLEQTAGDSSPASQHAAGVAYLLMARSSNSLAALERAASGAQDARVDNDLAAVYYTIATVEGRASHLPLALEAVDRALRLDPALPEAHFNRALILQRLGVREQARDAWKRYLEIDPSSGWSVEARARLRQLEASPASDFPEALKKGSSALAAGDPSLLQKLASDFPQEARTWGEAPLLAAWAGATGQEAGQQLSVVRVIAAALAAQDGDKLLGDAVAVIDRASGDASQNLRAAHRLYHQARLDYQARDLAVAEAELRRAQVLFRKGGSPMADVAACFAANAALDQSGSDAAREEAAKLYAHIDRTRHRALAAQIQWEIAVYANIAADWGMAAREATAAARTFRALGERVNAAKLDAIAAHALDMMGERDLAWAHRASALTDLTAQAQRTWRAGVLHSGALVLASNGDTGAAQAMMNVAISEAGAENPIFLATALADQTRLAMANGDAKDAAAHLASGRREVARIKDPRAYDLANARIELANAVVLAQSPEALPALDQAVAFFEGRYQHLLPDVLLQRARARRAHGDDVRALADYTAAWAAIERQEKTVDATHRLQFLDTAAQVIDESLELQLSHGQIAEAFALSDRSRGFDGDSSGVLKPLEVPPGVAVIEYAVLPRAVAIFVVLHGGIQAETVAIDRAGLGTLVASFTDRIQHRVPPDEVQRDAAALYALLIEPLHLAGIEEIVIVPDRDLHRVPFAALYDPRRRRYLIEDFTLRFSPTAAEAFTSAAGTPSAGTLEPALVVADPLRPDWPRLDYARAEAQRIAALYGGATLLVGDAATRARFVEAAPRSALIHYAGHADSDGTRSYGALLFAAGPGDPGILGSSEIAHNPLPHRPLVVLAACGTLRGDPLHVAGMSSLARAFLSAGARGVVASLWEIDDDVAAPLFLHFHQELRAGAPPARALRAAQLAMLHSPDPRMRATASWSAQALLGSP